MRALAKLAVFIVATLALVPLQIIVLLITTGPKAYILPQMWHKIICRVSGLRFTIHGTPATSQVMYVANHISYLDIPVLGAALRTSFVAKSDVASWPVFGFLAKIQQTAFISRKQADAARVSQSLGAMLGQGKSLVIFPEGTSSIGETVLPFRSSLFNLLDAQGKPYALPIQPITLAIRRVNNQDVSKNPEARLGYAWVGDMTLVPHLWSFWCGSGADIDLIFHSPLLPLPDADRKILAQKAHESVLSGLAQNTTTL